MRVGIRGAVLAAWDGERGAARREEQKNPLAPPYRVLTLEVVVCPALLGQPSGLGGNTGVGKIEPAGGGPLGEGGQTPGLADLGAKCREKDSVQLGKSIISISMNLGGFSMPIESVEIPTVALTTAFLCRFSFTHGPLF